LRIIKDKGIMSISGKVAAIGYNSVVSGKEIYDEIEEKI